VSSVEDQPYNWIGRLTISYLIDDMLYNYLGTAFLIDSRFAVTAGHCLYSRKKDIDGQLPSVVDGRLPENITLDLGLNGTHSILSVEASNYAFHPNWKEGDREKASQYDIGIVCFPEGIHQDEQNFFIPTTLDDDRLKGNICRVTGYPSDLDNAMHMYSMKGRITEVEKHHLYYEIDTYGGQSGSPIWRFCKDQKVHETYGVHAYGMSRTNMGVRFSQAKLNYIEQEVKLFESS
tara:strand:- start:813 stop:1514 length:702 start_codon:yes stop_codon:yes gene_type:complete